MVYDDVVEHGAVKPAANTLLRSRNGYVCDVQNARFGPAPAYFPFFKADCRMPIGTKVIHFAVAPDLHLPPQLPTTGRQTPTPAASAMSRCPPTSSPA